MDVFKKTGLRSSPEMRFLVGRLIPAGVMLFLFAILLLGGCFDGRENDTVEVLSEKRSPNGQYIATSFSCSGGGAAGGGDAPENVRQALHDALSKIKWSSDEKTLKIIFLVGDAPAHLDYNDVPTIEELCLTAAKSDIIVNTIRCGRNQATGKLWQNISLLAEGKFFSIDASGGVVAISTPYDKELGILSDNLGRTVVAYGSGRVRSGITFAESGAKSMAAPMKADRIESKAYRKRLSMNDLVDSIREKRVKLEDVKTKDLPEVMQKMTMSERKAYLEKKSKEREEVRKMILELSKKRQDFIKKALENKGTRDSFDQVVEKALREQAAKKGIVIK
ncbi:MAG: hypothetical protein QF645_08060 [Planctomycetota bacterium]|nr:hypothetical protein [Planctomycetota bacterium]